MNTVRTMIHSPIGELTLTAAGGLLVAIQFEPRTDTSRTNLSTGESEERGPGGGSSRDEAALAATHQQLDEYFAGQRTGFDLPLPPAGTSFQERVRDLLRHIPYGRTRSYGDLARELGDPKSVRAVGAANGRNPLPVVVPCHRVIGADGSLTGYAGGLTRKRFLLDLEKSTSATTGTLF